LKRELEPEYALEMVQLLDFSSRFPQLKSMGLRYMSGRINLQIFAKVHNLHFCHAAIAIKPARASDLEVRLGEAKIYRRA
jgi:hypothetical protein